MLVAFTALLILIIFLPNTDTLSVADPIGNAPQTEELTESGDSRDLPNTHHPDSVIIENSANFADSLSNTK